MPKRETLKPKVNRDGTITVRIRASGQVIALIPSAAYPMLHSGVAEQPESMTLEPAAERAIAPAQFGPSKKTAVKKRA